MAIISAGVLFIALTINPTKGNESNPNAYGVKKVVIFSMEGSSHVNVLEKLLCILPNNELKKTAENELQDENQVEKSKDENHRNKNENKNESKYGNENNNKNMSERAVEDLIDTRIDKRVLGSGLGPGVGSHNEKRDVGVASKSVPGQNVPGQNVPGQNVPGQNIPGQNIPELPLEVSSLGIVPLKDGNRWNDNANIITESLNRRNTDEMDGEEEYSNNSDNNGDDDNNNSDSNNNSNNDNNINIDDDDDDDDNDDDNDDYSNSNGSSSDDYDRRGGTAIHLVEARTLVSQNYKTQNNGNSTKKISKNDLKQITDNKNKYVGNDKNGKGNFSRRGSKAELQHRNSKNENSIKLIGFESKSQINKNDEEYSQYIENLKNLPESSSRRIRTFDFDEICGVSCTPDSLVLQRAGDAVIFSGNLQNSITVQDLDSKLYVTGDTLFEWSRGPAISGWMYKQSVRMCVNNNSSTYGTESEKEHKSYFRLRDNKLQYSKEKSFLSQEFRNFSDPAEVKVLRIEKENEETIEDKVKLAQDILLKNKNENENEKEKEKEGKEQKKEHEKEHGNEKETEFLATKEKIDSRLKKTDIDDNDKLALESDAASVSTSASTSTLVTTSSISGTTSISTSIPSYIPLSFSDILFPKQNTTIASSTLGASSDSAPKSYFRAFGEYAR